MRLMLWLWVERGKTILSDERLVAEEAAGGQEKVTAAD